MEINYEEEFSNFFLLISIDCLLGNSLKEVEYKRTLKKANAYFNHKSYEYSYQYLLKSLKLANDIYPEGSPDIIAIKSSLIFLNNHFERYSDSKDIFESLLKDLENFVKYYDNDEYNQALTLMTYRAYIAGAESYNGLLQYDKSIYFLKKAIILREDLVDDRKILLGIIYLNLGVSYKGKKEYEKSEEYFFKAVKIEKNQTFKNYARLFLVYNSLGEIYYINKYYSKALIYYEKCLPAINLEKRILKDKRKIYPFYQNMALNYFMLGDFNSSLNYFDKISQTYQLKKFNDKLNSGGILFYSSVSSFALKDYKKSEYNFKRCLKLYEMNEDLNNSKGQILPIFSRS